MPKGNRNFSRKLSTREEWEEIRMMTDTWTMVEVIGACCGEGLC